MINTPFHEYYLAVLLGMEGKFVTTAILKAELARAAARLTRANKEAERIYSTDDKEFEQRAKAHDPGPVISPNLAAKLSLEVAVKLVEEYTERDRGGRLGE